MKNANKEEVFANRISKGKHTMFATPVLDLISGNFFQIKGGR
jgi:hypothetical protein